MAYIGWCIDIESGSASLRQAAMAEHLAYIEEHIEKILVAGPIKNEQGAMIGSLFIYNAETKKEAQELLEQDPYYRACIWQSADLFPFHAAAGTWCGGLSWKDNKDLVN